MKVWWLSAQSRYIVFETILIQRVAGSAFSWQRSYLSDQLALNVWLSFFKNMAKFSFP